MDLDTKENRLNSVKADLLSNLESIHRSISNVIEELKQDKTTSNQIYGEIALPMLSAVQAEKEYNILLSDIEYMKRFNAEKALSIFPH